mmetsp:Transcript_23107/g.64261  ORF Transcript_23107/g.64261 Transcript_23107/m.64261 type:complete len:114 (-) Transcript_23107:743-1084(-)
MSFFKKAAPFDDARRRLFRLYPHMEAAIDRVQREVFGYYPKGAAPYGGYNFNAKQLKGVYIANHYPSDIMKAATKHEPGLRTEQQQRRLDKLEYLRRRGKGPPKKGGGKRTKK